VEDHHYLKPYRTEWTIYHEDAKIAGSIDMVYENPDGTLEIYDWKRCKEITAVNGWNETATNPLIKHLPATNFWQYSLQLNTYKKILEEKYGKRVTKLCLVRIHPDSSQYELLEVPFLDKEVGDLFAERM
jgi:ATP-dependent exoDNAse (exonuclease V) beta subunit